MSDESRLGILPFFSLPPFCLFCYHCSVSLYFAKYNCTFRSSVLFSFASLPLFLQFIGEFLFMCRVCCEMQFVWANYQLCTHVLLYVLVSFLGFIFCIVGKSRVPGTRPKICTGTRAHEIPEIDTPIFNGLTRFRLTEQDVNLSHYAKSRTITQNTIRYLYITNCKRNVHVFF